MNPDPGDRARCPIRPSGAPPRQIIGQAYVVAHNLVTSNREGLDKIASVLMARKEIFGDELVDLLDSVGDPDPRARLRRRVDLAGAVLRGSPHARPPPQGVPAA